MKDCDLWNPIGTVRDTVRDISQDIIIKVLFRPTGSSQRY